MYVALYKRLWVIGECLADAGVEDYLTHEWTKDGKGNV